MHYTEYAYVTDGAEAWKERMIKNKDERFLSVGSRIQVLTR